MLRSKAMATCLCIFCGCFCPIRVKQFQQRWYDPQNLRYLLCRKSILIREYRKVFWPRAPGPNRKQPFNMHIKWTSKQASWRNELLIGPWVYCVSSLNGPSLEQGWPLQATTGTCGTAVICWPSILEFSLAFQLMSDSRWRRGSFFWLWGPCSWCFRAWEFLFRSSWYGTLSRSSWQS
jgi:hypothetical protein